jgi:hypothetical protein
MIIKPTHTTLEQAKLLKEKGFDVDVESGKYGHAENENWVYIVNRDFTGWKGRMRDAYFESKVALLKPEQWIVKEWLLKKHKLWVHATKDGGWWFPIIENYNDEDSQGTIIDDLSEMERVCFNSPQEAISAAFDHILKNMI